MALKRCSVCATDTPLEDFYKNKSMKDGRHCSCRSCCLAHQRAQRIQRAERQAEKILSDGIDYERIISHLKTCQIPTTNRGKLELINEWNTVTAFYLPRKCDEGKPLRSMEEDIEGLF
jgi:hypothetical protein